MNTRQKKKQANRKPFDKVHSAVRYEIAEYIKHRVTEAGVEPNTRAIWSYTRWLAHNLSDDDWFIATLIACGMPRGILTKPISEFGDEELIFLKALDDHKVEEDNYEK